MKGIFKVLAVLALTTLVSGAFAQSAIVRGESSAGVYQNVATDGSSRLRVADSSVDPCLASSVLKSSAVINISTAATTSLVAPSGSLTIYVCGYSLTISQVVTTANTFKFVTGTGATCGTGTTDRTGAYGTGGVTAGIPIHVIAGYGGGTVFTSAAADRLCATTTIGASAAFVGVVSYVQQ